MAVDIERVLRNVLGEVMASKHAVTFTSHERYPNDWSATVESIGDDSRTVVLRATMEWFALHIENLDVGAIEFDYDGDQHEKEAVLRELALVAAAYLADEAQVDTRPRRFGRPARVSVTVEVSGRTWVLRKRSHSVSGEQPERDWC